MEEVKTNIPLSANPSSIALKIAVIDIKGNIISINAAWAELVKKIAGSGICAVDVSENYITVCRKSADSGNVYAQRIIDGIEAIGARKQEEFYLEYPCTIKKMEHWFAMTIKPLGHEESQTTIIQEDITEKKLLKDYINSHEVNTDESELQNTVLGSFELSLKDNTTKWSDEHFRIFGLEPQSEAMTYDKFLEFVHPAYIGRVNESQQRLIRDKKDIELFYRIVLRDGSTKYIQGTARPNKKSNGNVTGFYGTVRDVTESFGKEIIIKEETLHHSQTPVAVSDLAGIMTYANPAFAELWGFENESEPLGLSNKEFCGSTEKITEIMNAVRESGGWSGRDRAKKRDGTLFDIYVTANLIKDSNGMPLCVTATFIDITEQEKAKQCLLDSQSKAQTLFDYSPILIWEEDFSEVQSFFRELRENGVKDFRNHFEAAPDEVERLASLVRVTQVNQRSLDFYGVSSLEELETNLPDWFLEDTWDVFREELISLAEGEWQFNSEMRVKTPSGEIKHLDLCLTVPPQYIDSLEVVVVSFVDITETKEKEALLLEKERQIREYSTQLEQKVADRTKELRFSEAKLVEANKQAKIGHWSIDDPDEGIKWSDGLYEIYGLDKNTPISKEVFIENVQVDNPKDIMDRMEAIERGKAVEDIEYRIIDAKGNEKYIRSIDRPVIINSQGKGKTRFGVIQDITKQKEVENLLVSALKKEQELNELKSRFVSMASHEFRTPLSAILSSVDLLKRYHEMGISDKQEKHFKRIKGSVSNLITILNDFLSLEKMESGEVRMNIEKIELREYVKDVLKEVRPWAKEKQKIIYEHEGCTEVQIDPNMTRNILLNLLSNGLKYSPENSIVKLITQIHDGKLILKVIDNGIGIPEEEQSKMFSRFFRASNAAEISGTGLGLTIVKRYLDVMGGEINLLSQVGQGTTFTVSIPLA